MSRQEFSDPDLSLILEISGNNQCFDCLSKNPRFCSVNNGVLLCGICARAHQYYNNNVSRIKSLEADLWSKEEVKYLRLGGNTRLKNLFVEYDIPNDLDNQDYKYHTKIAEYYRTLLGQETRNRLCLLKRPNFSEGKETIEKVPNNQNDLKNNNNDIKNNLNEKIDFNNNIINNDDDDGYIFGLKKNNNKNNENKQSDSSINFNKMIDSIGSFFNRVGEKINEKSKEYDINGKINNIKNSDTYKSISEKFDKGINIIQQKTNELISDINNTNEYEFYAQQEINNQLNSQPNFQSNYSNISSQSYYNKNINNNNNNNQNQFNSNLNNNNNMNNINNNNMNNINNNNMNNINNNMNNLNNNNINNNVVNPIKKSFDKNIKDNIIENNINNNYNNINENINDINALNINENDSINKKEENNNFDINQKNEEKLD